MDKLGMAKNKNRRASFRIFGEANLFYIKIDEKSASQTSLNSELEWTSQNSAWLLPSVKVDQPQVTMPDLQFNENHTLNVNISTSGMAFNCDDAFEKDDCLAVKILLVSGMKVISARCRVVYCKKSNPYENLPPYVVGVEFTDITEADRELLIKYVDRHKAQQLIIGGVILVAVGSVLVMPAAVFGLLLELFHFLFEHFIELSHIAFEMIESGLDHLIEFLFETSLHDTQVIVFYILVAFASYWLYRLWRAVPPFCRRWKNNQIAYWTRKKESFFYYWREQLLINKIKWIAIGVVSIIGYIFFGF
jgi:hypothetical protein